MKRKMAYMLPVLVLSMAITVWAQNGPVQGGKFKNANGPNGSGTCLTCGATVGELSSEEITDLVLIRQDEKLARDVYIYLGGVWDVLVFDNIAESEQIHSDAIKRLIDRYDVTDPVAGLAPGIFDEPFATYYADLTTAGKSSLEAALKVGAYIEELDIDDLMKALERNDQPDIEKVYSNLLAGSENHLRAFVSHLQVLGVTYDPVILSPALYNAIMSATGPSKGRR